MASILQLKFSDENPTNPQNDAFYLSHQRRKSAIADFGFIKFLTPFEVIYPLFISFCHVNN